MTGFHPAAFSLKLLFHRDAHAASGSRNHAHRAFERGAVEVGHFRLCDFLYLSLGKLAHLDGIGFRACRLESERLLDQNGRGGSFQNERKGTILINRHDDGDDKSRFVRRLGVEFLSESGQIDTEGTERGAYGGRRSCFSCGKLQFYDRSNLFSHK